MSGLGVLERSGSRRRAASVIAPVLAGAIVLGACGGSDDDAGSPTATTLSLNSTAFATIPPATTTTVPEVAVVDGISPVEQEYEIQFGDFPLGVADRFGITVEEIAQYNDIADCTSTGCDTFPAPGTVIRIPPDAQIPEETGGGVADGTITVTGGQDTTDEDDEEPAGDTIPEAGDNCGPGSYTIEEGDTTRIGVAEKFGVSVAELDAANAGTNGYSSFFPGLQIVIPARDDC
ncbi:MAG: LysM peptidoglycan-binding domain-containing protein [Actinomycetota bacterium]